MKSYSQQVKENGEITCACVKGLQFELELAKADLLEHDIPDEERSFDFRIRLHDGDWSLHTGDASYDQDHRGAIGAGSVHVEDTETDIRAHVHEVLEQAREAEFEFCSNSEDWEVDPAELDTFERSYIEAMLWSETTGDDGTPLETLSNTEDLSQEALRRVRLDCASFQSVMWERDFAPDYRNPHYSDDELAGHDFWLTRSGHGAWFWSREALEEEIRDKLTALAKSYGEQNAYIGDDGKVYLL